MRIEEMQSGLSARGPLHPQRGACMNKAKGRDELRPQYKRSDFGTMVRGKYAARFREESNVAILEPEVAKLFPNSASVNSALRALAEVAERSARLAKPKRARAR